MREVNDNVALPGGCAVTENTISPEVGVSGEIDVLGIMKMIPHRYPMLLIDRIKQIVPDQYALGRKCLSVNEHFFQGHFPERPVMPGVLIIESMAQTAAVLVVYTLGRQTEGKLVFFMSIEEARFRKPIVPGDVMDLDVKKIRQRGAVWKFRGEAKVDGVLCAEAVFTAMIVDP
ncbi:MAG: 3-hydroxyacyl-ACP dehydratase FabZ [Alphaproteobacteria bacterium]